MKHTLGVKVDKELYERFIGLPGNNGDNLRSAIRMYIRNMVNLKVNHDSRPLNHEQVQRRVDDLIRLYYNDSGGFL